MLKTIAEKGSFGNQIVKDNHLENSNFKFHPFSFQSLHTPSQQLFIPSINVEYCKTINDLKNLKLKTTEFAEPYAVSNCIYCII